MGLRGFMSVYGFTRVYRFAGFRDVNDLRCVVLLSCLRKRNHVMFWEGCHLKLRARGPERFMTEGKSYQSIAESQVLALINLEEPHITLPPFTSRQ